MEIESLIRLYYKIKNTYKKLFYKINNNNNIKIKNKEIFEKEYEILEKNLLEINNIILLYIDQKLNDIEIENLKIRLIDLNNIYNDIYNKFLCYS